MNKILIANRSEIAVRVIRTAQSLGYSTVAVFSDADKDALHVELADQAVHLGGSAACDSYLNAGRIIAAAQKSGADAVHPGYGFLSENAEFARKVIEAGLTWIGPSPESMQLMGNKVAARAALSDSDIPLVPGYCGNDQSDDAFVAAADDIGFPVMVKAASGGGGRGMRLVTHPDDLANALAGARSESLQAFDSDELFLEKAIANPRHIEFQVFADQHGNTLHLGERDCSIQRRHQKVIEEAPGPAVTTELRQRMGAAAVEVARAVNYMNAGTVEFLLDDDDNFYFIEMNTRLQVEHPVTELITGFDLVEWQLLVAEGNPLPVTQQEVRLDGHAIEARLYAESPENNFLPSTGTVEHWEPASGDGCRIDHGLKSGQEIAPFYDAMIAKVITHGPTRDVANRRLRRALENTVVLGVETNRRFLQDIIQHPSFVSGSATTSFIQQLKTPTAESDSSLMEVLGATVLYRISQQSNQPSLSGWGAPPATFQFDASEPDHLITVESAGDGLQVAHHSQTFQVQVLSCHDNQLNIEVDGFRHVAAYAIGSDSRIWIQCGPETASYTNILLAPADAATSETDGKILAPMPGSVLRVEVAVGDPVENGRALLVLEAMKMEQTIEAPVTGTVSQILVEPGQQVTPRQLLMSIESSVAE